MVTLAVVEISPAATGIALAASAAAMRNMGTGPPMPPPSVIETTDPRVTPAA